MCRLAMGEGGGKISLDTRSGKERKVLNSLWEKFHPRKNPPKQKKTKEKQKKKKKPPKQTLIEGTFVRKLGKKEGHIRTFGGLLLILKKVGGRVMR